MARDVLTDRQYDVLRLKAAGMSHQNIALALDISVSTVHSTLIRSMQLVKLEMERREAA